MASLSAELERELGEASVCARQMRDKAWSKLVQCREEKVFATGMIRVVRLDIAEGEPERVVSERAMSPAERQADLFVQDVIEKATKAGSDPPESFSELSSDDEPPPETATPGACSVCGEVDCKKIKYQLECGDFAHDQGVDCPLGAFCTGLATITKPDEVLPPEEPKNGKGRKKKL